ncbi:MAG: glycosyltransferase [Candidatus Choladocola sp.]|nr:glycosyltransferase [Candidatus Choladocola sp.]
MESINVSVIIPVYNMAEYIDQCVECLLKQTYKSFEVIFIDDGSKDNSLEICKGWASKYKNIKVLHKENGGVSSARNAGINEAVGEYLLFVDADDCLAERYVETLFQSRENADIVICGFSKLENGSYTHVLLGQEGLLSRESVFYNAICNNVIYGACWNKLFQKKRIIENSIRFNEAIAIGEDMLFLVQYLSRCESYYYINKPLYIYRINNTSAMHSVLYHKQFNPKIITCLKSVDGIEDSAIHENEKIRDYVFYRKVRTSVWLLRQMILGRYEDKVVFSQIKQNCAKHLDSYMRVKADSHVPERVTALLISISPGFVYKVGKTIYRLIK